MILVALVGLFVSVVIAVGLYIVYGFSCWFGLVDLVCMLAWLTCLVIYRVWWLSWWLGQNCLL